MSVLWWFRNRRSGKHAAISDLRRDFDRMREEQAQDRARVNDAIEAWAIRDAARRARQAVPPPPPQWELAAQQGRRGGQGVAVPVPIDGRTRDVIFVFGDRGADPVATWAEVTDPRFWKRLAS